MKYREFCILLLILAGLTTPVLAANEYRYSYITIDKIGIELVNEKMYIGVDYSLDTPIKILIFLLGNNDLKTKLSKVVNYENESLITIDQDHAQFVIDDAVIDYGDGAMWLPEHQFNAITPLLIVNTPQGTLRYTNTDSLPRGIGYFRTPP
jgi:hypothetical protein